MYALKDKTVISPILEFPISYCFLKVDVEATYIPSYSFDHGFFKS